MATDAKIAPALTAEEWAKLETARDRHGYGEVYLLKGDRDPVRFHAAGASHAVADPHGAAALCLHGQPFGFTREDVDLLRGVAAKYEEPLNPAAREAVGNPYRDLADRIEALLPPEE